MRVAKVRLFSVLHGRRTDARPGLAQRLPAEFDTDAYPGLLPGLGLDPADLTGEGAERAQELARLDADPHGRFQDAWRVRDFRERRDQLHAELDSADASGSPRAFRRPTPAATRSRGIARRSLAAVEAGCGLGLLTAPGPVLRGLGLLDSDGLRLSARLLGARWIVQAGAVMSTTGPAAPRAAAVVSSLHAVTMLPVALRSRYRRAALTSATLAIADAGFNAALAGRSKR